MLRNTIRITVFVFVLAAHAVAQTITIDAAANRTPISPLIYAVGLATEAELRDLNSPLNRLGGNQTSRYNWQANAYNHALDFYWESIGEASAIAGDDVDRFIRATKSAASEPMVTIPMVGWVAKLGPNGAKLASFSIQKYGPQKDFDRLYFPDAGNGVRVTGELIVGNDPNDANIPADVFYEQAWAQHLVTAWGPSRSGGVRYYTLDNEPSLWHGTHRDVHPNGQTLEELRDKIIQYAQMIKLLDPNALVVAPEEWGWLGYRFSGADQQFANQNGWNGTYPDRIAHGNVDQLPWLLGELARAEARVGKRLVDICAVHIYPQSGEHSDDVSAAMQLLRNRSTRSLWDRNYRDVSYIAANVYLIPRMHDWVSQNYPGTRIGITEYNWGAESHINGATAQADIFGIFGREGLDLATRYATPPAATPTYKAIKMYRNYDGNRSTFGDVSVQAVAPDPDTLSGFAAIRTSDGVLTAMLVNKQAVAASPTIALANYRASGVAEVWQLTSANVIGRMNDVAFAGNRIDLTLPAQSVTLLVIRPGGPRGDANGDGAATVADIFYLINFLFAGGPAPIGVGDANSDGAVTVADIFFLINYLFAGGPAPAP